jgi:phage terminase large subunit-like protein
LYEQGKVFHIPGLDLLEQQMVVWEPLGKTGSPDRLDACVWALTDLMLGGVIIPRLSLNYTSLQELENNE